VHSACPNVDLGDSEPTYFAVSEARHRRQREHSEVPEPLELRTTLAIHEEVVHAVQ